MQVGNSTSSARTINYSVPQGSCAGPVLYTMYAATLDDHLATRTQELLGYADDHSLVDSFMASDRVDEHLTMKNLEHTLTQTKDWMQRNMLKMNDSKSELIMFGSSMQLTKVETSRLYIGDCVVQKADSTTYLGVTLDAELQLTKQITKKCSKASFGIHLLRGVVKYLSLDSAKTVASAMVLSHIDYANSIYSGLPTSTIKPLQRIQNFAAKVVLKRRKFDSASQALRDLHWLPVGRRADFKLITIVHKALHGKAPLYIAERLHVQSSTGNRCTRSSADQATKLVVPFNKKKTFGDRSFSTRGPQLWNALPENLRSIDDFDKFKASLKTYFFNH